MVLSFGSAEAALDSEPGAGLRVRGQQALKRKLPPSWLQVPSTPRKALTGASFLYRGCAAQGRLQSTGWRCDPVPSCTSYDGLEFSSTWWVMAEVYRATQDGKHGQDDAGASPVLGISMVCQGHTNWQRSLSHGAHSCHPSDQ